jgi:rare lipoprotein A (peptidoglycan hydrolase)
MAGVFGVTISNVVAAGPAAAETNEPQPAPTTAQAASVATTARAADVVPGKSRLNVLSGRRALVSGHLKPGVAGRRVVLQKQTGNGWKTVDRAHTRTNGAFTFRFRANRPGSASLRLHVADHQQGRALRARMGRLNVYRRANVSWYGPGFYGRPLGCGGTMQRATMGVAHKTLPCGTRVTLRHNGRIVRTSVVDRGPYVGGREYDLTAATKERLGFSGVGTILATR